MQQDPHALVREQERHAAEARASREFGDALRAMAATGGGRITSPEPPLPDPHADMNAELRQRAAQSARSRSRAAEEQMR